MDFLEIALEHFCAALAAYGAAALQMFEEAIEQVRRVSKGDWQERGLERLPDEGHHPPRLGDNLVLQMVQASPK